MKAFKIFSTHRCVFMFFIFACIFYLVLPAMASERFLDNGNGTITDKKTDLMWVSKDNGTPINWLDAIEYCKNLRVGGYTDWRMPTMAELASLFNPNKKNKSGYHTIELISTTAQSCWASETRGNSAGRFNISLLKSIFLQDRMPLNPHNAKCIAMNPRYVRPKDDTEIGGFIG